MARYEKISLSKEMFAEAKEKGVSLSELLSKSEKFNKESKLSVLEQQLAARDLAIAPGHASLISDFYKTDDSRVLFVETINQAVRMGMNKLNKSYANLSDIVATRTGIQGGVYEAALVDIESSSKVKAKRVAEGSEFPVVTIAFKGQSIKLGKFGYKIKSSYETVRRCRANVFLTTMQILGQNISMQKLSAAVDTLINGDGNGNPIATISAGTTGTLKYADTVNLEESFENYEPTLMLSGQDMRIAYRNLEEYKNRGFGPVMMDPPKKVKSMPAGRIIAIDSGACIEEVYENGGSLVEYQKIISEQFETAVVSEVAGYSVLFRDASRMLKVTA